MSQDSNFFAGQPAFKQIIDLVDKELVRDLVAKYNSDWYVKSLKTYEHLIVMLYGVMSGCNSLRELVLGLTVKASRLRHLGLDYRPPRSTISDANARRGSDLFGDLYMLLYDKYSRFLSDSRASNRRERRKKLPVKKLVAYDSTTITLFMDVLKGCDKAYERGRKAGRRKGGIKVHSLMNVSEGVIRLACLSEAAMSDSKRMRDLLTLEPGSMATFDKGYSNHEVLEEMSRLGIFYTTRLKDNVKYETQSEILHRLDSSGGVASDSRILLSLSGKAKHKARRIEYIDSESGRRLVFLTNNFKLKAETIARIYRERWKIELMFKKLKQNFQLKYFYGDSANAVEIQVWCVLIASLLMTAFKAMNEIDKMSFSNMMFATRCVLMEYVWLRMVLAAPEKTLEKIFYNRANAPPTLFD